MLDVRRLRILRELADRGTIAATADALGYTPPAVSQQLAALEREVGVALLEPAGRGRRLTGAGRQLVAASEAVFRELEAAEATVASSRTEVAGAFRCAGFETGLRALMVPAARALKRSHAGLRVAMTELEPEQSLPMLRRRELDLALAQDYAFAPSPPGAGIERVALLDDPVRVAVPAGSLPSGPVALADLSRRTWAGGAAGSWCHRVVIHGCRAAGFEPDLAHLTTDYSLIYGLVASDLAVALVPDLAGPPPEGVDVHDIAGPSLARRVHACIRAGTREDPAVAAVLAALQTVSTTLPNFPDSWK